MRTSNINAAMISSYFNLHQRVVPYSVTGITSVVILASLFLFSGCKKNAPQLETDRAKKLLTSGTWVIESVTIDGVGNTDMYAGLTLTFTGTSYTAAHGGLVWPASGTWSFADETGKRMLRGDDLMINVREISATQLVLELQWTSTTFGPGRVSSISGEHVFTFGK